MTKYLTLVLALFLFRFYGSACYDGFYMLYTHYHNSNLIWRNVSRRVDEVIPSDPMVWPHPRDMILYARSSYYYGDMFIICLFLTFFLILKPVLVLNPEKLRERLP